MEALNSVPALELAQNQVASCRATSLTQGKGMKVPSPELLPEVACSAQGITAAILMPQYCIPGSSIGLGCYSGLACYFERFTVWPKLDLTLITSFVSVVLRIQIEVTWTLIQISLTVSHTFSSSLHFLCPRNEATLN